MGLDISFYLMDKKLTQEEVIEFENTKGIGEDDELEWFCGRSFVWILDTLRDDLKSRYGRNCFDYPVRLEYEDIQKLILENVHNIVDDKYRVYTSVLSLLMSIIDGVDFEAETVLMVVST